MRSTISGPELSTMLIDSIVLAEAADATTPDAAVVSGRALVRAAASGFTSNVRWLPPHPDIEGHAAGCGIAAQAVAWALLSDFAAHGDFWSALVALHSEYSTHSTLAPLLAASIYRQSEEPANQTAPAPIHRALGAPVSISLDSAAEALTRFAAIHQALAGAAAHQWEHHMPDIAASTPFAFVLHAFSDISSEANQMLGTADAGSATAHELPADIDLRLLSEDVLDVVLGAVGRPDALRLVGRLLDHHRGIADTIPPVTADLADALREIVSVLSEQVSIGIHDDVRRHVAGALHDHFSHALHIVASSGLCSGAAIAIPFPDLHVAAFIDRTADLAGDGKRVAVGFFREAGVITAHAMLGCAERVPTDHPRRAEQQQSYRFAARLAARRALAVVSAPAFDRHADHPGTAS